MRRLLLCAALAGCGISAQDDVAESSHAVDVTWMNPVGVATSGNDLTKTGATGWNAGAASVETIPADGYVEFTTGENTTSKMAGLSVGDAGQHHSDIDFAFYLKASGGIAIYEAGVQKLGTAGTYVAGDVFRVAKTLGVVKYSLNGAVVYTSSVPPGTPMGVDTSLNTPGATLQNVRLVSTQLSWQNAVGVAATGNDLTKTDGQSAWNAGASSVDTLTGDGYAEFRVGESTTAKMVGLGNGDSSQHYSDIEYAIWLKANGVIGVYESGVQKSANLGTYEPGDLFRVQAANGVVRYSKNGQPPFYTSGIAPSFPLLLDTSLYTPGATVNDARMVVSSGPVCEGFFIIDDAGDADLLAGCTTITGQLAVNAPGLAVSLPNLEQVGALLVLNAASIDLPALDRITGGAAGGFDVAVPASLPALTGIGGGAILRAGNDLPVLASIDGHTEIRASTTLPALEMIDGTLNVYGSLSAPVLTEVRGNIIIDAAADSILLPALVSAYSFKAGVKRTNMTSLDLSSLAFLGGGGGTSRGDFTLATPKRLTSLSLPSLQSIEGIFYAHGNTHLSVLQTIEAPLLEATGGTFSIDGLIALTSFDFSSLTSVGSSFNVSRNFALPNCYATSLRDQLLAAGWSGTITISGNDPGGSCP